jgi:hypothetical protein
MTKSKDVASIWSDASMDLGDRSERSVAIELEDAQKPTPVDSAAERRASSTLCTNRDWESEAWEVGSGPLSQRAEPYRWDSPPGWDSPALPYIQTALSTFNVAVSARRSALVVTHWA